MDLSPDLLLSAYCQGIFPMADEGQIYWYDPDPRAILPLDALHISHSLARSLRSVDYQVFRDRDFGGVIRACAEPSAGREETWISAEIITAYEQLAELGFAHTVEIWQDGRLVGGLYGVAVNGLFAGESMFSLRRDASKIALVHLVGHLREQGFRLLDIQFMTEHLRRLGAREVSRSRYKQLLAGALQVPARFEALKPLEQMTEELENE
jgi:leucyl/phenylalanyl-tRNA--protein transferase